MRWHDIEQNTDDWMELRAGKLTSSRAGTLMANAPKWGEPQLRLVRKIAAERHCGMSLDDGPTNKYMEMGHELEPIARELYAREHMVDVDPGGFFERGNKGASPDGLVGDDGVIEIKSVIATTHALRIESGGIDPKYRWQIANTLHVTGREWLDFVSYCPQFPRGQRLFVHRCYGADFGAEYIALNERIVEMEKRIKATLALFRKFDPFGYQEGNACS